MQTVLNEYDLASQVPRPGGMGLVYRARRTSGEIIALKIIPLTGSTESRAFARSERRGATVQQMLAELDPHVPRVYNFGEKHGVFFIEMEFIEGEDLSSMLSRLGALPPREAARIAQEVAAFLHVAHGMTYGRIRFAPAQLVHADLKPANIRIAKDTNDVRILDFGIAKAAWNTHTAKQFGSTPYMSPERIEGRIDRHADYWALGVVLYEMLAGRPPFTVPGGVAPSHLEQLIVSRRPPPPLPASIPIALQAIVSKMLHGSVEARYQTAADIKADLAAYLSRRAPSALVTPAPGYEGATIVVQKRDAPRRRRRVPLAARAAMVLAMLAGLEAYGVSRAAMQLRDDLAHQTKLAPDAAWARYERIRRWAWVPIGTSAARAAVKEKLVTAADRVLADFRRDQPTVRASHWRSARAWLEKALAIDEDARTKARLLCAEGHLLRIEDHVTEAIARFQAAAQLDSAIADPYLGLARIYRSRADRARQLAGSSRGFPEEKTFLLAAAADYQRAVTMYAKAQGFGAASDNIRQVRVRLAQGRARLAAIETPPVATASRFE